MKRCMNAQITFRILTFKIINFRTNEILAQSFRFAVRCQWILSFDMLFLKFNWHLFYYRVKSVCVKLITNFHRSENIKYQLHA
jgi:hypothetical protein